MLQVPDKDSSEVDVASEAEPSDESRLVASDEAQVQTSAERRVTRSAVRQQQNKCKQKAESSTSSAHDSTPRTFNYTSITSWNNDN